MPKADAEIARAALLDFSPGGFEEVEAGGEIELALYGDAATEDAVRGAFDSVAVTTVEPGWEDRWRSFHRPVLAAGLWIGPPWEAPPVGVSAVTIDPGRAFGTGAHPTTRASIELLAGFPRGSLLDAGCGSGVVAIAAARLGFGPVTAVDVDPVAVEVAAENARANAVSVDVRRADVLADVLPRADVVVANIELAAVEALLGSVAAPRAVVAGYLVRDRLHVPGWLRIARVQIDGWAADSLVRA